MNDTIKVETICMYFCNLTCNLPCISHQSTNKTFKTCTYIYIVLAIYLPGNTFATSVSIFQASIHGAFGGPSHLNLLCSLLNIVHANATISGSTKMKKNFKFFEAAKLKKHSS